MSELFHKNHHWAGLNEFIAAGKVTPQTHMRFNDACAYIRRNHGSTESNFNRALFRVLKTMGLPRKSGHHLGGFDVV